MNVKLMLQNSAVVTVVVIAVVAAAIVAVRVKVVLFYVAF